MWIQDELLIDLANRMSHRFNRFVDFLESQPSNLKATIVSILFQILWIPGACGLLGVMLACEKTEPWFLRLLGGAFAVIMTPFMLLTVVGLLVSEGIDKIKELRGK